MRYQMKLRTKVLGLPVVATVGFLVLVLVNVFFGRMYSNSFFTDNVGYLPALEQNRRLEQNLVELQRGLKDAADAANAEGLKATDTLRDKLLNELDEAKKNPLQPADKLTTIREGLVSYYDVARAATARMIAGDEGDDIAVQLGDMVEKYNTVKTAMGGVTRDAEKNMAGALSEAREATEIVQRVNIAIALSSIVVLLGLSLLFIRRTVGVLGGAISRLSAAAAEILALAKQTEANAADEAASVDETRRTMNALVEAANEIATSASAVLTMAQRSASAGESVGARITKLHSQAVKVSRISETIQGIADKSDILALNAALEGTKAGDAGQGFALVGAEMRRLAETVMSAAEEIRELAQDMCDNSRAAVIAAEEGQKLANETTEASKRITTITLQERNGTEQVSQSMNEVQQFTQQALTGARESKRTADDLVGSAEELRLLVEGGVGATRGVQGSR